MEYNTKDIIDLYLKRISLFQDLLNCINRERDRLIHQDIKGIWESLEEKEEILSSIEETAHHLEGFSEKNIKYREMPSEEKNRVMELQRTIIRQKQEIKVRIRENVSFVKEALAFLQDLIATMTRTEDDQLNPYGPYGTSRKKPRSMMYQGEA